MAQAWPSPITPFSHLFVSDPVFVSVKTNPQTITVDGRRSRSSDASTVSLLAGRRSFLARQCQEDLPAEQSNAYLKFRVFLLLHEEIHQLGLQTDILTIMQSTSLNGRVPLLEIKVPRDIEHSCTAAFQHDLWPLNDIEPKKGKFPCCLVWTPLPVVSWLAPFIGHVGICREDGTILDFSGSNFVNVGKFAFGAAARYLQLDREKCCFPPNLIGHTCTNAYRHAEFGTALTWDDALQSSMCFFETKSYNLFTCNCHSFAANCLNRLCYDGSADWNMVNVAALVFLKGKWVDYISIAKSFLPFTVVLCTGLVLVGWPFLIGLFMLSVLLLGWFLLGNYCYKPLIEC